MLNDMWVRMNRNDRFDREQRRVERVQNCADRIGNVVLIDQTFGIGRVVGQVRGRRWRLLFCSGLKNIHGATRRFHR